MLFAHALIAGFPTTPLTSAANSASRLPGKSAACSAETRRIAAASSGCLASPSEVPRVLQGTKRKMTQRLVKPRMGETLAQEAQRGAGGSADRLRGEIAASYRALHGARPAGTGPVAGE